MYCKNCGSQIPPESKFCPSCGTSLQNLPEEPVREDDVCLPVKEAVPEPEAGAADTPSSATWSHSYEKRKKIGSVIYRRIKTDVQLSPGYIYLKKATRRKKYVEKECSTEELLHITQKKQMDFWDGLYANVFAIFAIFLMIVGYWGSALCVLLLMALCLLTGYGNVVMLLFKDGTTFIVPMYKAQDAQELTEALQRHCGRPVILEASEFDTVRKKLSEH